MRERYSLNFDWKYADNFSKEYLKDNAKLKNEKTVNIPHTNIEVPYNNYNENISQFVSTYKKNIKIDKSFLGKVIILVFEGVGHKSDIYINGRHIYTQKCGYTCFEIDISSHVNYGKNNTVIVKTDSRENTDIPPFGYVIDYQTYGGIYREVYLDILEKEHIKDAFLYSKNTLSNIKTLVCEAIVSKESLGKDIIVKICDKKNVIIEYIQNIKDEKNHLEIELSNIKLWDTDNPKLYDVSISIEDNKTLFDRKTYRFGFREAVFRDDGFFLNGKRLKLIGLNRHQIYPYVGYAMPSSVQKEDARILKDDLALNCVRTSHYPQSRNFIEACDELGLLVIEEIPGWQHIGKSKNWRDMHQKNVYDMILRDRNSASIIMWCVRIDESVDDDELYKKSNEIAKSLDKTRATGGVRCIENSRLLEDVYTFNDFIYNGKNMVLRKAENITKNAYLVTEYMGHMYPTKSFDDEQKRLEHTVRHTKIINEAYRENKIAGVIGWISFDYNTHKDFGSGDRICYHGVMDIFRCDKLAKYAYASQSEKNDVLEVSSSFNIGEYPGIRIDKIYIFTNCDYVDIYRGTDLVKRYYPSKEIFNFLQHPPIIVDDIIGNLLIDKEKFTKEESDKIKDICFKIHDSGIENLSEEYKTSLEKDTLKLANDMYGKYVANWGGKGIKYIFKGYKNNKLVKTVVKGVNEHFYLIAKADTNKLIAADTYDSVRIEVSLQDENKNTLIYANDVIDIKTKGDIEVIGPSSFALIGGRRAFWVKTTSRKKGKAKVFINSERFDEKVIDFNITCKNILYK